MSFQINRLEKRLGELAKSFPEYLSVDSLDIKKLKEFLSKRKDISESELERLTKEYIESLKSVEPAFRDFIIQSINDPIIYEGWENV